MGLLPSQPFTKALAYAAEREGALRVYLSDASVAIDTNHLEARSETHSRWAERIGCSVGLRWALNTLGSYKV